MLHILIANKGWFLSNETMSKIAGPLCMENSSMYLGVLISEKLATEFK